MLNGEVAWAIGPRGWGGSAVLAEEVAFAADDVAGVEVVSCSGGFDGVFAYFAVLVWVSTPY